MPVLSEQLDPSMGAGGHKAATISTSTSSTYVFISFAILLTLGITLSRRKCKKASHSRNSDFKSSVFICNKQISRAARMLQATPPTSALPEKPYLPNTDAQESQQATAHHEGEKSFSPGLSEGSLLYTPQLQQISKHQSRENSKHDNVVVHSQSILPPAFNTRLGSLPAVTTSFLHQESPSATTLSDVQQPIDQGSFPPMQTQFYHTTTQSPSQPFQFQPYTQNEILFVPSPTEYTSFEALYSNFPPSSSSNSSFHHGDNPSSYTDAPYPSASTYLPASVNSAAAGGAAMVPRRRSYIKTLSNGSEVSGEVVEAAGQWRRHTRVFGGGVCVACEESESRRMSA